MNPIGAAVRSPSVYALVPAAGGSTRMGLGCSKALLKVGSASIIERTVTTLLRLPEINHVFILIRMEDTEAFQSQALDWKKVSLVEGGNTRQESVRNGLEYIKNTVKDYHSSYVLVHDAARCLVSNDLVRKSIEGAFCHKAITTAVPVVDSIKQVHKDISLVEASLERERLVAVQTPQVFQFDLLWRAHAEGPSGATDDSSLVELIHPVHVVLGEKTNIKVTTPDDLKVAEILINNML